MSTRNELKSMADFNKKRKKQTSLSTFFADPAKGIEHFNHIMGNDCNDCESSENVSTDVSTNVGGGLMEEKKKINIKEALNNIDKETMNTDLLSMYESCDLSLKEKQDIVNLILKEDIKGLDSYLLKKLNEEDEGDYFNGEDTNSDLDFERDITGVHNDDVETDDFEDSVYPKRYSNDINEEIEDEFEYQVWKKNDAVLIGTWGTDLESAIDSCKRHPNSEVYKVTKIKDELGDGDYSYELVFDGKKEIK